MEVSGFSGRNRVAHLPGPITHEVAAGVIEQDRPPASTTVRAALERRRPGVPGDLGWERVGPEVTLTAVPSGLRFLAGRLGLAAPAP